MKVIERFETKVTAGKHVEWGNVISLVDKACWPKDDRIIPMNLHVVYLRNNDVIAVFTLEEKQIVWDGGVD